MNEFKDIINRNRAWYCLECGKCSSVCPITRWEKREFFHSLVPEGRLNENRYNRFSRPYGTETVVMRDLSRPSVQAMNHWATVGSPYGTEAPGYVYNNECCTTGASCRHNAAATGPQSPITPGMKSPTPPVKIDQGLPFLCYREAV